MIKNNVTEKLSTADPIKMDHANDHLGETTKKRAKDENNTVIDDENRVMDVSSTVISSTFANLQKERNE